MSKRVSGGPFSWMTILVVCGINFGCLDGVSPLERENGGQNTPPLVTEPCDGVGNLGEVCSVGVGACQSSGIIICDAERRRGVCSAERIEPTAEVCDGETDEDCDGSTDEAPEGNEPALCAAGNRCVEGDCEAIPVEVCDGVDNDNDGTIDEGFVLGQACQVGVGACSRNGTIVCSADGLDTTCNAQPGQPVDETFNGVDDNCNGRTDEGTCTGSDAQCRPRCDVNADCRPGEVCRDFDSFEVIEGQRQRTELYRACVNPALPVDYILGCEEGATPQNPGLCTTCLDENDNGRCNDQELRCNGFDDNANGDIDEGGVCEVECLADADCAVGSVCRNEQCVESLGQCGVREPNAPCGAGCYANGGAIVCLFTERVQAQFCFVDNDGDELSPAEGDANDSDPNVGFCCGDVAPPDCNETGWTPVLGGR